MNSPKHTVIIITYNQEELIGRAIESLLCQKEFIYEIIIVDDCSPDKTWNVINEYHKQFPILIKPYQNQKNLGIFGNIESTWNKPNGDILWYLAGDDIYCDGVFREANKLIEKNNIDFQNEAFSLYFDYKSINPKNNEKVYSNHLIKQYNPISLKVRQLISNRTTCMSRKVFENFHPVKKDIGIMTDGLIDIQTQIYSNKSYYFPFVGSAYFTNIGVSSQSNRQESTKSLILTLEQFKTDIPNISKEDLNWLCYLQQQLQFKLMPNLKNFKIILKLLPKAWKKYYGLSFYKREIIIISKSFLKILISKKK